MFMLKHRHTSETRECTEWKKKIIEAVAAEARAKPLILFGGHSSGVTNKSKFVLSHRVTAAVKAASSESQNKLRKGWLDMKVDHEKDVSVQR